MKEVKSGWKTTEFWVTVFTSFGVILNQSGLLGELVLPIETVGTIAASVAAYVLSRGIAKK